MYNSRQKNKVTSQDKILISVIENDNPYASKQESERAKHGAYIYVMHEVYFNVIFLRIRAYIVWKDDLYA